MLTIAIGFHEVIEDGETPMPHTAGHTTLYTLERHELRNHFEAVHSRAGQHAVHRFEEVDAAGNRSRVLLTFDDGALGAYTCVAQELEHFRWPGHFFITTDWIGRRGFMDRHQIRELHQRGHAVGSHSRTHPERMSHLSWNALVREWSDSCAELSEIIGNPVKIASVPGGYYSRRVAQAAAAAGIEVLFTSEPTRAISYVGGCVIVGRYSVRHYTDPWTTGALAAGVEWPRRRQAALWLAKKIAKRITGPLYCSLRRILLARAPQP